jgi:hypothetical protein
MSTFADRVNAFNASLSFTAVLPDRVSVMNPFQDPRTQALATQFYNQFYADNQKRFIILGINPGRLGGGTTGVPFTDPIRLKDICEIDHDLPMKAELSSDFIYQMITRFGGAQVFYQRFFISAVCPLGFTRDGKNLNYYDIPALQEAATPFIVQNLQRQLDLGLERSICFCLGEGQNYKFLQQLNARNGYFEKILPLPHPRFIMQYRRKKLSEFIEHYVRTFNGVYD